MTCNTFKNCFCCFHDDENYDNETEQQKEPKNTIDDPLINDVKKQHKKNFHNMHNLYAFRRRGLFMFPFPSY
jgi:hypothetical protein